ncbi:MAG: LacI family DNA-binding transcriptional regulator [Geminicoccaceae bacterium]
MHSNPSQRIDLKGLAQVLGLSMTTVSRALNGYSDVSEKTRRRVEKQARLLGYTPNAQARRLTSGMTETIGFVLGDVSGYYDDPYFAQLLAGMSEVLTRLNYDLVISTRGAGGDPLGGYRRLVDERRVDGIVLDRTRRDDERIAFLLEAGMPFVSFGRSEVSGDHAFLDADCEEAGYIATRRLLGLSHRRIAFLGAPRGYMFNHLRLRGYERALNEAGLEIDPQLVTVTAYEEEGSFHAATGLLRLDHPPTAIVCIDDMAAMGAVVAVRSEGLEVGEDVSIIGYNDIAPAALMDPPLTTVRIDSRAAGRRLAEMLLAVIAGRPASVFQEVWAPTLVVRSSDGPAFASRLYPAGTPSLATAPDQPLPAGGA